ncbi:MAG: LysM peptidoglycan-binding domain-containing protein [Deltaproteobacteria bacterium]|nr:LysM peptidoglycan-binding domain-containing protein [Deltaproteobacteria bacterium]
MKTGLLVAAAILLAPAALRAQAQPPEPTSAPEPAAPDPAAPEPTPEPGPGDELGALRAVEETVLGELRFEAPDAGDFSHLEGMQELSRPKGLRGDQLSWELGTGGLRAASALSLGGTRGARLAGFDIPVVINAAVEQYLDLLQGRARPTFTRWLSRTSRYYPLMQPILRKHGLPEDLVSVALVESGLHYAAFSRARASGPWQFMKHTGARYGLKSGFWVDERRDFIKATEAAARHLEDLFAEFGDWYLAWAAYNAGAGRVRRAIERSGARDFWSLAAAGALAQETQRYVPKIIAAAVISQNPERYGFGGIAYQKPLEWEVVEVEGMADLKAAARAVGSDLATLKELNPELRFWCSPPDRKRYPLRLPRGTAERFRKHYRPPARDDQVAFLRHRLRPGETLSHVALAYRTSVEALMAANRIGDARRVRAGRSLIVPVHPCGLRTARARPGASMRGRRTRGARYHTVQPGDSLWSIAERYESSVEKLRRINSLGATDKLRVGKRLRVE